MEAAERYRGAVLDSAAQAAKSQKRMVPREMPVAFNWQEIAKALRQIREMPEGSGSAKLTKIECLTRLADIYEVLRAAKMPKLEAVRIALMNEAKQLRGGSAG